jgi:signal transduction histidine kinase
VPAIDGQALRWSGRSAAAGTALAAISTVVAVVWFDARFEDAGRPDLRVIDRAGVAFIAATLAATVVGASLLLRRPEHPVGWCFAALAVSIDAAGVAEAYAKYSIWLRPGRLPGADVAAVISNSMFVVWLVAIALVCSLTPDGRHLSRRWQVASRAMVATGVLWLALKLVSSAPLEEPFAGVRNPWAIRSGALRSAQRILAIVNNVLVLVAAVSVAVRFRRSRGEARRQLLWMAVIAVPFFALVVIAFVAATVGNDGVLSVAGAGFVALPPLGAWLAITRYRLYDVDRILSRAVSYLVVSALMAATYAIVVVLAARAIGQTASSAPTAIVLATLAVASAVRPVHAAVQDLVDRRFARRRYDAIQQMRTFVADPTSHESAEAALQTALGDPSLRVAYPLRGSDHWVSESGLVATNDASWVGVERAGRTVAAVSHSSDPSMVDEVLRVASPELDNAGLRAAIAVQLQEVLASRRRIARAQVDERRRIERDLHDGAQQRLLGTAAQHQAALLNGDPARMRSALELGIAECRDAVVELRELANGLHPSVLSDGGLAAALEQLQSRFPMTTVVEVPEHRYAPDLESTLWFVTCEALANALKHAKPSTVRVHVSEHDGTLRLTVDDDGCGGADPNGNGLRRLADRVEAVGGRLLVGGRDDGGTRVEAVVPCAS